MATAAAIEVIIRARDEASAAVATSMQKITASATEASTAISGIGRAGPQAAGAITDLVKSFDQGSESVGAMVASLGSMAAVFGGPWGLAIAGASQLLGAYIGSLDAAEKEQAKFTASMEKNAAQLRQTLAQQDALAARIADRRARSLREAGDPEGAAQAAQAATAALRAERDKQLEAIDQRERERAAAFRKQFADRPVDPQIAAGAEAERTLLHQRFAEGQVQRAEQAAKQQQAIDDAADRRIEQAIKQREAAEERLTQKRLQASLQAIDGERQIELIVARATTARETAAAQRLGNIEQITQAELAGLLRVRDAELKALTDRATARAQAARGPGREEDVLAIRQKEAQDTLAVNLATAAKVEEAWRAAQQRIADEQKKLIAEAQAAWEALAARMRETGQTTTRPSDLLFGQFDMDEQLRKAKLAQETYRQGGTITQAEMDLITKIPQLERGMPNPFAADRPPLPLGPARPMGPIKMFRDAAGGLTIADDFEAAATSADKVTKSLEGVTKALKATREAAPNLVQAISQGLADALTFAGARHP